MISRLLRKAVTRPWWLWQRRRPWPVRGRVFRLPPRPVRPGNDGPRLLVLASPAMFADAAWAARSFLEHLADAVPGGLGLTLLMDAPDVSPFAARWTRLFPGAEVRPAAAPGRALAARAPAVAALAAANPMGRKLAALLEAQETADVLYHDADVLLFGPAPELVNSLRDGGPPRYIREDGGRLNGEPRLLAHAERLGWPPPASDLNAGLLFLPRGCLPLADAEALLSAGAHDAGSWFVEQTAVALLMARAGARVLPAERYVVSVRGQFLFETDEPYERLTARHFTTPVRHRMYARGLPALWQRWRREPVS